MAAHDPWADVNINAVYPYLTHYLTTITSWNIYVSTTCIDYLCQLSQIKEQLSVNLFSLYWQNPEGVPPLLQISHLCLRCKGLGLHA